MDKFETETFSQICELVDDMQRCFIDDDAYNRTPSAREWRVATRNVHKLVLLCSELTGYASAVKMYWREDFRSQLQVLQNENSDVGASKIAEQGFFEYSDKEISKMPKKIQGLMIVNRKRCHYRRKKCGKNSFTYEVRFRAGGYNLSACGKTKELAKENMRRKLVAAPAPIERNDQLVIPKTFNSFAMYYFENFRKEKVAAMTYSIDLRRHRKYLIPAFGEKPIAKILPGECKLLIDEVRNANKSKTADELYSLLSIIFKGAIAHRLIEHNPMATVFHHKHVCQNGTALSKTEEEILLSAAKGTECQYGIALTLYCGLRPGELQSVILEGDFIKTINSKRKTRKTEYKRIYICDRLRPLLPEQLSPNDFDLTKIRALIRTVFPEHKLYDLRTTFNTRCKELGVAEPARAHFMGHSLGALGNAYTDLSDEYLLKEGKKLNFW